MTIDGWMTLAVIGLVLGLLIWGRIGSDIVLVGGVALLALLGVLSPKEAIAGMSNEGMVTVAVFFVIVAGLTETGAVRMLSERLLGRPKGLTTAMVRLTIPVSVLSGFMNNTPLVAMFIPAVSDWCKQLRLSPSKMMIPLSYAAVMGGTLTLIGTSTNLVVYGKWLEGGRPAIGMFELAWVGLPTLVVGLLYLIFVAPRLLPDRKPVMDVGDDPRSYTAEMEVAEGGPLAGRSIEQAGLRGLPGLYLSEVERDGDIIPAVSPAHVLKGGDRLFFVGVVESIADLNKIRGLQPATKQVGKLAAPRPHRSLVEAVVSDSCPMIGKTVKEVNFRARYNAVVIAVARSGEQLRKKIGDITFKTGDTLLLEAPREFVEAQKNSRDFLLVSAVEGSSPPRHNRAWIALAVLGAMIAMATLGQDVLRAVTNSQVQFGMLHAAVIAAGLMLVARCTTGSNARKSVDWQVLVVIAASLGLGKAMEVSGAASSIGGALVGLAQGNPLATLAMIYLATMLLTEIVTNNAAAVLMFSIAAAAAEKLGVDLKPYAMAIMMAASASFSSPIGYQTNLMVMTPGGYRFTDYLRVGIPINLLFFITSVFFIPLHWDFTKIAP